MDEHVRERIRHRKYLSRQAYKQHRVAMEKATEYARFFQGPGGELNSTEESIAKEKNAAADRYEEEHGRGADARYPGYRWVHGTLVRG